MKYLLTAKDSAGNTIDTRSVYARDKAHLKNLKDELRERLAWQGATKVTSKREQ